MGFLMLIQRWARAPSFLPSFQANFGFIINTFGISLQIS